MDIRQKFEKEMSLPYYYDDFITFVNQADIQQYSAYLEDEYFKLLLTNKSVHMYNIFENKCALEEPLSAGAAPDERYDFSTYEVETIRNKQHNIIENSTKMVEFYEGEIWKYIQHKEYETLMSITLSTPLEFIEIPIEFETIHYEYGHANEYGDGEVINVSRIQNTTLQVPKISFVEWIEYLITLQNSGIKSFNIYTKSVKVYEPSDSRIWKCFNKVSGNSFIKDSGDEEDFFKLDVFWIKDFCYFALLQCDSRAR